MVCANDSHPKKRWQTKVHCWSTEMQCTMHLEKNITANHLFNWHVRYHHRQKKTVLDTVNWFQPIPLDDSSKKLTTFITEWGQYYNCQLPQGYLAATNAYTGRYNEIIKDVPNKIKIVDDALLYDNDIETSFYHTLDYFTLCYTKGIIFNKSKFQFC